MKKKVMLLTVTLVFIFSILHVAAAFGIGQGDGGPRMLNSDKWASKYKALNLTEQQKSKMREIDQDTYSQTRDLRIKLMDSMHELKQLQLQPNPDSAKIEAKINEVNDLRAKIHGVVQQSRQQCRSLLTPEQQAQMKQFKGKKGGVSKGNWNR
ncbi:Heavy-metal resistance [Desulfotomaculum arcticum]|uniref:Heavy-metal resistance n=1 Tax=Desulfotruncus arcticus DSM 17038 TaxID=1121424 RepID=A0A1I2SD12_9FIRM|nr:Spy/CpxP family protein refolding chaperone [Desulfotruncus arcticus]SFG50590.1 Heavy-metal resistance [Desulfotomaculum arcticum] [Desulfotruncus arcticus DSM 17038]